jgi:hypothetical protein
MIFKLRCSGLFLILAASVLFASATGGDVARPNVQGRASPTQPVKSAAHHQADAKPEHASPRRAQDQTGIRASSVALIDSLSAQLIFTFVTTAATVFLAFFTCKLVGVTDDMRKAADAATRVAKTALRVDRPYLIVLDVQFQQAPRAGKVFFQNAGRGPADIVEFIANADLFDGPRTRTVVNHVVEDRIEKPVGTVIASGDKHGEVIPLGFTQQQYEVVQRQEKWIAVYGRVRYRGGPPDIYTTSFFWWYGLPDPQLEGYFFRGPPELNIRD